MGLLHPVIFEAYQHWLVVNLNQFQPVAFEQSLWLLSLLLLKAFVVAQHGVLGFHRNAKLPSRLASCTVYAYFKLIV